MSPRRPLAAAALAAAVGAAAVAGWLSPRPEPPRDGGLLDIATVVEPAGSPDAVVFLFSETNGWRLKDEITAKALAGTGAVVVGVDLPATLARIASDTDGDCSYVVGDVEDYSHTLQKTIGDGAYRDPVVAGSGAGGALALALAAQTPKATIGRIVATDPAEGIAVDRPLCTDAPRTRSADGARWVYGLEPHALAVPVDVAETPAADAAAVAHVASLEAAGFAIDRTVEEGSPRVVLARAVEAAVGGAAAAADTALGDLPLTLLPATPLHDTMAIVLSGDGGWRDIDSQIAGVLADKGVPTIGLDSMRYFWSEKPPATIAADLHRIIETETAAWGVHHVVLIGYSFGADVLPATWAVMPEADRARVRLVSLMALSGRADFEFQLGGLVGMSGDPSVNPTLPDVRRMPAERLQCVYGEEDEDAVCSALAGTGVEIVRTTGGHHFDGDYEALADRVIDRLKAS